ncbi:MAG: hypothetical protein KA118_03290 [Verrucomicrobia bacterium]|nr:hypothetical protein [Verrucomicrobiota bacterium]
MDQTQSAADTAQTEFVGKLRVGQSIVAGQLESRMFLAISTNSLDLIFSSSTKYDGIEKSEYGILWQLGHQYAAKGVVDKKGVMTVAQIRYVGPDPSSGISRRSQQPVESEVESGLRPEVAKLPKWTVPSDWKPLDTRSPLTLARFRTTGEAGRAAEITVVTTKPQAFGIKVVDHVNRWHQQVGQPAVQESDLKSHTSQVQTPFGDLLVVEVSGKDDQTSVPVTLIGAILQRPEAEYFYRIRGDSSVVDSQKEAFLKFVRGVEYAKE